MVRQNRFLQAEPGDHTAHEPVLFAKLPDRRDGAAAEEPEVADFNLNAFIYHRANDPIEQPGRVALQHSVTGASRSLCRDHVITLFEQRHHFRQQLGWVLEIRIHNGHGFA